MMTDADIAAAIWARAVTRAIHALPKPDRSIIQTGSDDHYVWQVLNTASHYLRETYK